MLNEQAIRRPNEVYKNLKNLKFNKSDNGPKSKLIRCLDVEYNLKLFERDLILNSWNWPVWSNELKKNDRQMLDQKVGSLNSKNFFKF